MVNLLKIVFPGLISQHKNKLHNSHQKNHKNNVLLMTPTQNNVTTQEQGFTQTHVNNLMHL